ncbi:glutathione S-transferase family protein [Sphingomonas yabuuchiae]|uniref:Glutathione S-transferase n=1 Tax=Sphingomonas yabuuchiae TaxID=172044 RepID=A0AA41A1H8_9SPHN|nr:glutathione S-transferase family protein [Sphingomonas yabuuchiae]MBB4609400.1 putative glutathione S-transferase [Sphingomonas yabuuchiae]MBN3560343.1 glutathione S-transferase family protein [Sphingomonas yabuuchiae]
MGNMMAGIWHADGLFKSDEKGSFKRPDSGFRDWVTADGEPGPDGQTGHRAEAGRYHLYVSYACPWAHRTMIVRALKGLEDMIGLSVVDPLMRENGWTFATERGGTGDQIYGSDYLWQLYARARDGYSGKVTVPVLWDKQRDTIVSNESAEIIRMFNTAFDGLGAREGNYYPADLREEIDAVNATVYDRVNNGVYKCGFAKTQAAYDEAVGPLFAELDALEARLKGREWLVGDRMTEADIRLFTTLVRFDAVYHGHFKCNVRRVQDYPALEALLERMLAIPEIAATVHLDHIKTHYYASHLELNPTGIVPAGPDLAWAGLVSG